VLVEPVGDGPAVTSVATRTITPGPDGGLMVLVRREVPSVGGAPGGTRELELIGAVAGEWRIVSLRDPGAAMTARFEPPILLKPASESGPVRDSTSVAIVRDGSASTGRAEVVVSRLGQAEVRPLAAGLAVAGWASIGGPAAWGLRHEMTIKVGPARVVTTTTSVYDRADRAIVERRELVVKVFGLAVQRDRQAWVLLAKDGEQSP
jgi:hypothetical protein